MAPIYQVKELRLDITQLVTDKTRIPKWISVIPDPQYESFWEDEAGWRGLAKHGKKNRMCEYIDQKYG